MVSKSRVLRLFCVLLMVGVVLSAAQGGITIKNKDSRGKGGVFREFVFSSPTETKAADTCSGSCSCSTCSCYGTYSCCSAGCGACFSVACDAT
jgi:hypothetical protein